MKIVWQYTPPTEAGFLAPDGLQPFRALYSPFISGMRRLNNGNTLINEGLTGASLSPDLRAGLGIHLAYWGQGAHEHGLPRLPRALRVGPRGSARQEETPIERIDVNAFRMPGAAALGDRDSEIAIEGCAPYEGDNALCVASVDDPGRSIKHGRNRGLPCSPSRPTASFTFCASPLSPLGCLLHAKSLGPARALYVFMPRCPVRKRTAARRLPAPGPSRHAVNENTGSGHAYAARSRPPRRPSTASHC